MNYSTHKLVISEKPSVAMSISKILGANNRKDGYMQGGGYIVSWCVGHLIGLAEPEEYDSKYGEKPWRVEHLPIIPVNWKFAVNKDTKKQYEVLKKLMNSADVSEIVCATDSGREGECIFRYVYTAANCRKPFKRLWISSLEESAIREGFKNLRRGSDFDNLYASGFCRAKADYLIGYNLTRLYSAVYRSFLSVGRVQTPTLAMIAERDYKVKNFIKEKFYTINLNCGDFVATSERIDDLSVAERIAFACEDGTAAVTEVKRVKKAENPPKLYDLTTLQREANRQFSFSAQETLDITQKLYEKKLVTYPRTDSQFITEDMAGTASDMIEIVMFSQSSLYSGLGYKPDISRVIDNSRVSDHTAVIPTAEIAEVNIDSLPDGERKILSLIMNKLLCSTADKHEYETVSATVECGGYSFTLNNKRVIKDGWKAIERRFKGGTDSEKPLALNLTEGQRFNNCNGFVNEKWTSPPKHYTEDTLLQSMETAGNKDYDNDSDVEKKGIGTPATRAATIETLIKRGYVVRDKKNILVTDKGDNLIKIVPDSVKSARLTAEWETVLQKIAKGEYSADRFMSDITAFTRKLVADNSVICGESANVFVKSQEKIGKCPKCGGTVIENSKAYSCGKKCGFVIWKTIAKKAITAEMAIQLLEHGKTDKIAGFKGKNGDFEAMLVVKSDFTIGFKF